MNLAEYHAGMQAAIEASKLGTCPRKQVGAAIPYCLELENTGNLEFITGTNRALKGLPQCNEVGCDMENNSCQRTIHAEQVALAKAAKLGSSTHRYKLFTTTFPCFNCLKLAVAAGISEIVYLDEYRSELATRVWDAVKKLDGKIKLTRYIPPEQSEKG